MALLFTDEHTALPTDYEQYAPTYAWTRWAVPWAAMRLLTPEAHAAGMTRVRQAQARGELWRSHYVVLHYAREHRVQPPGLHFPPLEA
jgi:hypothetical protein